MEPLKNTTDDPRIRLLNRLYAKKRKELKEREKLKVAVSNFFFLRSLDLHLTFSPSLHFDMNLHNKSNACHLLNIKLIGRVCWDYTYLTLHLFQNVESEEECVDERSVDDLLQFINGGERGIIGYCFYCTLYA